MLYVQRKDVFVKFEMGVWNCFIEFLLQVLWTVL